MTRRVVIIGGGFTGLAAARVLARSGQGLHVTVLEAGAVMGGLAAGFPLCGTLLEKAYHYLLLGDTCILDLIRELGLGESLVFGDGSVGIYDGKAIHSFSSPLDVLRFPLVGFPDRIRLGLAMWRLQRTRDWRPLARQTAREWLMKACGPSVMRVVWDPLLRGKFDRYFDQVSMAWLWARIHTRANSRSGAREQLVYPRGGFGAVTRRLEEDLRDAGVELRTRTTVESITTGADARVLLAGGEQVPYDQCLFTGPSWLLARFLPPDPPLDGYRTQLESVPYLAAICVVLVTDQELGHRHWVNIHEPGAPFLVFINHTALVGTELYQGRHVYYLGCYCTQDSRWAGTDDAALLGEWLAYLGRMFPGFSPDRVSERHVFRFRNAQHVVDCDYEAKIPAFRTPAPGLYLANFSQVFPQDRGTNFAVRDGQRVAELMLDDVRAGPAAPP